MPIDTIDKIASSQSVFSILFLIAVYVAYKITKQHIDDLKAENKRQAEENTKREAKVMELYEFHKKESSIREVRLMEHLEKTTDTLVAIQKSLEHLDEKVDNGLSEVWKFVKKEVS